VEAVGGEPELVKKNPFVLSELCSWKPTQELDDLASLYELHDYILFTAEDLTELFKDSILGFYQSRKFVTVAAVKKQRTQRRS
jgi:hypothetical protein